MNAGGLPQWPAKFLIPLGFFLLFLQGISEIIKRIAVMRGRIADPHGEEPVHTEEIMASARWPACRWTGGPEPWKRS